MASRNGINNLTGGLRESAKLLPAGAVAGMLGTVPMTAAMEAMHAALPHEEQYPLPPEELATVIETRGLRQHLDQPQHLALTWLGHFGYGTAMGALYGLVASRLPIPPIAKGVLFGLAVWSGSYLGWLPAAGLMSPATKHPARRNLLMIVSHCVWGAALGTLTDQFDQFAPAGSSKSLANWRNRLAGYINR